MAKLSCIKISGLRCALMHLAWHHLTHSPPPLQVDGSEAVGVGFDATCSLVCLGDDDAPRGVDPTRPLDRERNVVVWLDHRATEQASRINAGKHRALDTVGGTISPEMEVPKLLWLKEKLPDKWLGSTKATSERFSKFFDLPDWLVYRATGADERSLCTTVTHIRVARQRCTPRA